MHVASTELSTLDGGKEGTAGEIMLKKKDIDGMFNSARAIISQYSPLWYLGICSFSDIKKIKINICTTLIDV